MYVDVTRTGLGGDELIPGIVQGLFRLALRLCQIGAPDHEQGLQVMELPREVVVHISHTGFLVRDDEYLRTG